MSKNTGTSELINYFDLGVNGDVGIAGSLTLDTIANATTDTDTFLVSDTGIIKYRTGAQLLSDIGAQAAGNYVTLDTAQSITGVKTFNSGSLILAANGTASPTIIRNTSGTTGSTGGFNTIGFNSNNNIFVDTTSSGGFIFDFNNSVSNRTYTLQNASGTLAFTSQIPTVAGVYLPLAGGTMTGALNGTSATFSGGNYINGTFQRNVGNGSLIEFKNYATTTQYNWFVGCSYNNSNVFEIIPSTAANNDSPSGTSVLSIASTGAATFSSTLQTTHIGINNAPTLARLFATQTTDGEWIATFKNYGGSSSYGVSIDMSGSTSDQSALQVYTRTGNGLRLVNTGNLLVGNFTDNGARLQVSGAATVSSTIFANTQLNNTVISTSDSTNITNGFNLLGSQSYWGIRTATSGDFKLDVFGAGVPKNALSIAQSTGAATFSASAAVGGLNLSSTYASKLGLYNPSGSANMELGNPINTNGSILSRIVSTNASNGNSGNESSANFIGVASIETQLVSTSGNASGTSGANILFLTKADGGILTERMRITSGGTIDLKRSSGSTLIFNIETTSGFSGTGILLNMDAGSDALLIGGSGSQNAINVTTSTKKVIISNLGGSGTVTVQADNNGTLIKSSDSVLKQEDKDHKIEGLAEILQLQPRAYKWLKDIEIRKEEAVTEIGFFADEVNPIIPSAAPKGFDGLYGFNDRAVIATLVKAIQEQQQQIQELKNKLS